MSTNSPYSKGPLNFFFNGWAREYRRTEYTKNFAKTAARKTEYYLAEYRAARFRWAESRARWGRDDDDTNAHMDAAFHARAAWQAEVRWVAGLPIGGRYCNCSPVAQASLNA